MKFQTDVTKVGGSLALFIPARLANALNLEKGNIVEADLEKISELDNKVQILCPNCKTIFAAEKDDVYDCSICGENDITSVHEIMEEKDVI